MAEEILREIKDEAKFAKVRIKKIKELYADEPATRRATDNAVTYRAGTYKTAAEVRKALLDNINNPDALVEMSKKLYAANPIYASVINYMSDMYCWRYKVTPHKVYSKSKAKLKKTPKDDDFQLMYSLMLEVVDGLSIEHKFPELLSILYTTGSVYYTTICDEESIAIDTILLPTKYCRKIAETQYGTAIIEFDYSYFTSTGLSGDDLKNHLATFPKEMQKQYARYVKDGTKNTRWQVLDPHYSSGIMLNEVGIPTYLYLYGGILDYEQYQDNELERNENLLKYIVVHTMPHYEDKLLFEVDEVDAMHKSLRKVIDKGEKTRLVTTYGDVHLEKVSENDTAENQVLSKAFKAIFNNAGFNSGIFTAESVEALKMSLVRDKGMVWKYVQELLAFYTIAINNWFDFKEYQADIEILPISPYTYGDDIEAYKNSATLGVGKLDYLIASGIKQKNIQDQLYLESFLHLEDITPMRTSYTDSAVIQKNEQENGKSDIKDKDNDSEKTESEIEPSETVEVKEE